MKNTVAKLRLVLGVLTLAAGAVLVYSSFPKVPAQAQGGPGISMPQIVKSAGPISLQHNESALIGLLLPAVQRARESFRLVLFDSAGSPLVRIPVAGMGDGSVRTAFFDVFFGDGSVRVLDHATGKVLAERRDSDGVFSAMLLPAVQRNGQTRGALSASIQLFNADHVRGQVVGMCDGSV